MPAGIVFAAHVVPLCAALAADAYLSQLGELIDTPTIETARRH
jgi:hypothetical protein